MFKGLPGSLQTYCVCLSCLHVICTTGFIFAVLQLCSYHGRLYQPRDPLKSQAQSQHQGLLLLTYLQNWGLYFFKKLLNWDTVMHSSVYSGNTCCDRSCNLGFFGSFSEAWQMAGKIVTFRKGLLMGVWGIDLYWLWNRNCVPSKKGLGVAESCRQLTLLFILYLGVFFFNILLERLSGLPTKSVADQVAYLFQQNPSHTWGSWLVCLGFFFCFVLFSQTMLLILAVEVMFIL